MYYLIYSYYATTVIYSYIIANSMLKILESFARECGRCVFSTSSSLGWSLQIDNLELHWGVSVFQTTFLVQYATPDVLHPLVYLYHRSWCKIQTFTRKDIFICYSRRM